MTSEGGIMDRPIEAAIVGCGSRGRTYAKHALERPDRLMITAIAEPVEYRRKLTGDMFGVPEKKQPEPIAPIPGPRIGFR